MYDEHAPIIAAAMRADLATFKRGVMFAVISARTRFFNMPAAIDELKRDGANARCLWGWKRSTFEYLEKHGKALHRQLTTGGVPPLDQAMWDITRVPGLGAVKGAFVLQLMGYDVACLDVRNVATDNLPARAYRGEGDRKAGQAYRRTLDRYIRDTEGKARHLWDRWCTEVGSDNGVAGEVVSRMHVDMIVPPALRRLPEPFMLPRSNELPF